MQPNEHPVAIGMKLSREGDERRRLRGFDSFQESSWQPEILDDHKAWYYLWSRTYKLLHGDTEGVSLASCEEDSKVY